MGWIPVGGAIKLLIREMKGASGSSCTVVFDQLTGSPFARTVPKVYPESSVEIGT